MANSLQRDIQENEVVVLKKSSFKPEYQALEHRLFKIQSGFGMRANTMGTAIFGEFLSDGEKCRMYSMDIDKKETEVYQSE